uniref:TIR domain-containing adapter molecule 1 n=1 Tax=Pristiophorus japonicus TaxID=55135 RepID=UPI00398F53E7
MAEDCDRTPSLDDLFDILSGVPEERLRSLWYKFNPDNPRALKAHRFLYSIISFLLKKKDEAERAARLVSNETQANRSALYIINKIRGSFDGAEGKAEISETSNEEFAAEDGGVLRELAWMYAALVEENLCSPSVRNRVCRAAVKAFKSNNQNHSLELQEFIEEFRLQFGSLDFEDEEENTEVSALKSIEEPSPSMRSTVACRTNSMTIPGQIPINTSEITIPSHFEISASPTVSFTSNSCGDNLNSSIANPKEFAVNPANSNNATWNNYNNAVGNLQVTHSMGARPGEQEGAHSVCPTKSSSGTEVNEGRPTECTGRTNDGQVVTSKSEMSGDQGTGNGKHTKSVSHDPSLGMTKLSNSSEITSGKSSLSGVPSEPAEASFEDTFYPFVILHSQEDAHIAESVQVRLESLGVESGATFEEFSLPGLSPIKCIDDAVNNSAFTILLLTSNFNTQWEDYQANTVLMHSINNEHKNNTVIPLLPKKDRMRKGEIPFALSAIIHLDENSTHFERHVKKLFKKTVLEKHKKSWLEEQTRKRIQEEINQVKRDLLSARKTLSAQKNCMQAHNQLAMQMQQYYPLFQPIPPPHPGPAGVNGQAQPMSNPPLYPGIVIPPGLNLPPPQMFPNQPTCNPQPAFCSYMPPPFQVINPGTSQGGQTVTVSGPVQQQVPNIIQIQNAKNVQIGDSNQMTITESTESSEGTDSDEEEEEDSEHN